METEKPKPKWAGLGYEQVPGLANRIISRYLRGQRRNMERFFAERGLMDSAERMRKIRLSRQGMLAKNRMFQEVLGEYAQSLNQPATVQAEEQPAAEAAHLEVGPNSNLGVQNPVEGRLEGHGHAVDASGVRSDDGGGLSGVEAGDVGDTELVIEE